MIIYFINMSNLYSGKGDKGRTDFDGQKVSKSSDVIEALGCLMS